MLYSLISLICAPCFLLLTFIALSGTLENLLQSVDEIKEGKIKEVSEQVLQRLGKLVLLWYARPNIIIFLVFATVSNS